MDSRKWSGEWWVCSEEIQDVSRVPGVLSYTEDGYMELALSPAPNGPSLKCKGQQNYTIWGEDRNGIKITLFNAYVQKYSGGRVDALLVNYALIGAHVSSFEVPIFRRVVAKYPNLRDFLFVQQVQMGLGLDFTSFKLESPKKSEMRIPVESGTDWVLYGNYEWKITHRYADVHIHQDTHFIIENKTDASLSFYLKQIGEFSDFLSLALQGKQRPYEIGFYLESKESPKYEFYYNTDNNCKMRCNLIGDSVPTNRLYEIITNWHKNYNQVAPIYSYLERSSFDNKGIAGIPEFLLIEFAVEGYFKRYHNKIKTNNKDIQQCKDELNQLLKYYAGVDLIKTLNLDVDSIVATRDTYVHLRPETEQKGNELRDAHDIWVATEKLRILLLCCLLDSMGFSIEEIDTNFKTAPILHPEQYQNEFLFE